jgi:hypothetical protein
LESAKQLCRELHEFRRLNDKFLMPMPSAGRQR